MLYQQIQESIHFLKSKTSFQPRFGIILGTGMGNLTDEIDIVTSIDYRDIPHFPESTVQSHKGKLIFGYLADQPIVAMAGRFHHYEGYSMKQITFPVRVMKFLGIQRLFISNAAGSVRENMFPGDIVFIKDHINLHPDNPLRGKNDERLGPRFPDMLNTYERKLNAKALEIAREHQIRAHEGVYVVLQGPNLETPAEYRFMNIIGADLVGMSTVPEVIVSKHMDLPVFVFSIVSNQCFPIEIIEETPVEKVIEVVSKAEPKMRLIVMEMLRYLSSEEYSE
ncbi:MAG: purine-nucleoside phosphorylase [Bacteroidetes bacterium]|nr:purine-nucleoside phosphorylase [Bacteroidota bacterium]